MKQFKDFGITTEVKGFIGDKIKVERILNRKIIVHDFKIEPSKFDKGHGLCLHMQIEVSGNKHVIFCSSMTLMEAIKRVSREDFPFETIIEKKEERFQFT